MIPFEKQLSTNRPIVYIAVSEQKKRSLRFLLDPGAEVSVVKIGAMDLDIKANPVDVISLQGVTNEKCASVGSVQLNLKLDFFSVKHKTFLVTNSFPKPCDGLLGSDFFSEFSSELSFRHKYLKVFKNKEVFSQIAALEIE